MLQSASRWALQISFKTCRFQLKERKLRPFQWKQWLMDILYRLHLKARLMPQQNSAGHAVSEAHAEAAVCRVTGLHFEPYEQQLSDSTVGVFCSQCDELLEEYDI